MSQASNPESRIRNPEPRTSDQGSRVPNPDSIAPIGVFDSGVGGLSVLREIRRELPAEDLIYVADSGYAPYGDRPEAYVRDRALAVMEFLRSKRAKAVVVACNTATGIAVDALRARYDVPIVAIEPAVKPAVAHTRAGVVGVLATTQTLAGQKFAKLVSTHAGDVEVLTQACPGLVEQVEEGLLSSESTRSLVERYLRPMLDRGADTIVLGCTHYPFVSDVIREVAGPTVTIVDSAAPVARELRRRLQAAGLLAPDTQRGAETFWTTGSLDHARAVIGQLWDGDADVRAIDRAPDGEERSVQAR
jgi:glutamate racemase